MLLILETENNNITIINEKMSTLDQLSVVEKITNGVSDDVENTSNGNKENEIFNINEKVLEDEVTNDKENGCIEKNETSRHIENNYSDIQDKEDDVLSNEKVVAEISSKDILPSEDEKKNLKDIITQDVNSTINAKVDVQETESHVEVSDNAILEESDSNKMEDFRDEIENIDISATQSLEKEETKDEEEKTEINKEEDNNLILDEDCDNIENDTDTLLVTEKSTEQKKSQVSESVESSDISVVLEDEIVQEQLSDVPVDKLDEQSDVAIISESNNIDNDSRNEMVAENDLSKEDIVLNDKKSSETNNSKEANPIENVNSEVEVLKTADNSFTITNQESAVTDQTVEILDVEDSQPVLETVDLDSKDDVKDCSRQEPIDSESPKENKKPTPPVSRLTNTLDILSDDEEEPSRKEKVDSEKSTNKQCINLDDDDDIMLIDDEENKEEKSKVTEKEEVKAPEESKHDDDLMNIDISEEVKSCEEPVESKDSTIPESKDDESVTKLDIIEKPSEVEERKTETKRKPLIPDNFFKSYKKNLTEMTRDDLEEFCILKIVESIIDRSNLSDIRSKLKTMAQTIDEFKKKTMMLTKQNRDLQVVLKSIQEEQKKSVDTPITPLKITRSVGMQVLMTDKSRKRPTAGINNSVAAVANTSNPKTRNTNQTPRTPKTVQNVQQIPVPRLVPAANILPKAPSQSPTTNAPKTPNSTPNGIKTSPPPQKPAEKRTHNRSQSVTVDLTDDEPPAKVINKNSPVPPVRLVPSQNLMPARQTFPQSSNSPRKVYIPISGPQAQGVRAGSALMLKTVTGSRPRGPVAPMVRLPQTPRVTARIHSNRHPAPLPDAMKQYQPPNWKNLPPAPDLKLSKVENGIVISWKIDGYQEDAYEEIASYQLYAYQETTSPPSTSLWKKIGDVKALPLPMACTLTQFMAGYKYYFAVRAVDIRSRLGPFSLPGSILLLNKI